MGPAQSVNIHTRQANSDSIHYHGDLLPLNNIYIVDLARHCPSVNFS